MKRAIQHAVFAAMYEDQPDGSIVQRPKAERRASVEGVIVDLREEDIVIVIPSSEIFRFQTSQQAQNWIEKQ